ncbi:hypothetical protein [Tardiphaga sp. 862_B3_N1_1]|uniref:hypothetical protein n=1 Tax=Tardiphaga sp. 862_B3_N1_1 TaxID=3240763 RepID=UPI003F88C416
MMQNLAPSARLILPSLLLAKASHHHDGMYKHGGGYYLLNGRWHSVKAGKQIPKGAPVAAHKHAAGQFEPVKHLTDDQWQQLQLPTENSNASTFNKQLASLKEMSEAGDVTGILGMSVGSNTYGKKIAVIANHLLGLHGTEHKVAPGQKSGTHAAIQSAPEQAAAPAPAPAPETTPGLQEAGATAPLAEHVKATLDDKAAAGDAEFLQNVAANNPEHPQIVAYAQQKLAEVQAKAAPEPAAAPAAGLAMPAFEEGKTTTGVKAYYDKVGKQVLALAAAGDAAGLAALKAKGLQPNSKGKVGNTWNGKTGNSKMLLAMHAEALAQVGGGAAEPAAAPVATPEPVAAKPSRIMVAKEVAAPAPAAAAPVAPASNALVSQIPWDAQLLPDSNKNAKSHNGKVAQIKAMAEAGDIAGLEAFKAGTNTYGKKQNLLAQTALAALKEGGAPAAAPAPVAPVEAPAPVPAAAQIATAPEMPKVGGHAAHLAKLAQKYLNGSMQTELQWMDASIEKEIAKAPNEIEADQFKQVKAYAQQALAFLQAAGAAPAASAEQGPKDGDTKPGADGGTLVFKDGRWHKQSAPEPAAEAHFADSVPVPTDAINSATNKVWAAFALKSIEKLKDKLKAGDVDVLKGATKFMNSTGKYIVNLPHHAHDGQTNKLAGTGPGAKALYEYVLALKGAAGMAPKAAAKPTPKAAPVAAAEAEAPAIEAMDTWEQTGAQGGSNPGGRFKDSNGVEWYCKFPADESIAKSEVLAAKLYAAAGVEGQDAKLITKGGKVGIASRWITVSKAKPADLAKAPGATSGFAVDAWLANWDVIGMGYDNLQIGVDGNAVRVDAGGSLEYRAQGSKKPFGNQVDEIDTLRDAKVNANSAAIFGKMTKADVTASVAKVAAIGNAQIRAIVEEFGPGDLEQRKALANTLIARKADLLAKYPKAAKSAKKRLDPTQLPVKPDLLAKPHDFANWHGAGKGLSSKAHINAANTAVEQQAYDVAMQGNLPALKEFKYNGLDKETGNATGAPVPIAQHPSKHVVQYHADLVTALDEIANPPQPLKIFRETEVGTMAALKAAFPPKPFGTTVKSVSSTEKMGFWVALGAAAGVAKFAPKKTMDYTAAAIAAAKKKFADAKPLAKHFIKSVQASGSYNDLFRDGKTHDHSGNALTDVAKAALEHATEMPEGTSIYRWQTMTDQMLGHIMSAPDGTVFQATGPMCTSYSPTATKGFGKHRIVIRYAKGAKAVESFASGGFAPEKEVTTLPNNRFIILSKKMVPDTEHGNPGAQRAEIEVLMLPPDLGIPGVKG